MPGWAPCWHTCVHHTCRTPPYFCGHLPLPIPLQPNSIRTPQLPGHSRGRMMEHFGGATMASAIGCKNGRLVRNALLHSVLQVSIVVIKLVTGHRFAGIVACCGYMRHLSSKLDERRLSENRLGQMLVPQGTMPAPHPLCHGPPCATVRHVQSRTRL